MALEPRQASDGNGTAAGSVSSRAGDGYDAARRFAAVQPPRPRGLIAVAGDDAVSFLQGILTNDIVSLAPGHTRYAAYLTPQGRMISDMRVFRRQHDLLLEVEPPVHEALTSRLDASLFTEDVRLADRTTGTARLTVCGPGARELLSAAIASAEPDAVGRLAEDGWLAGRVDADDLLLAGSGRLSVPSVDVLGSPQACDVVQARLTAAGAATLAYEQTETLRIEAGTPIFGMDMTEDTIPLEAGIEGRAISMTKGCYIGQEVIVRILHRGAGRVARKLVGLHIDGASVPVSGSALTAGGKAVGHLTSVARSPRFGVIALGYVHRDLAAPGSSLVLAGSGQGAVVAALPFGSAPGFE